MQRIRVPVNTGPAEETAAEIFARQHWKREYHKLAETSAAREAQLLARIAELEEIVARVQEAKKAKKTKQVAKKKCQALKGDDK